MSKRSPDGPRRVTMSDVARRAGVSQPTVSFVLNDRRDVVVAEETRRRVLAAGDRYPREARFYRSLERLSPVYATPPEPGRRPRPWLRVYRIYP